MIKLIDLIKLAGLNLENFKIHCATGKNPTPLEAFFNGTFRQWQEQQTKKNFECEHVLSLIHLGDNRWLFAGVYEVLGVAPGQWRASPCYQYSTRELNGLDHLTGKVIVDFERGCRQSYLRYERFANLLHVVAIREQRMTIVDFPGFNAVLLSHVMLKTLIRESIPSWRAALSNVAGVYLITDTKTGKHYVGGTFGGGGIWQRWTDYARTGHGENKELRELLRAKGKEYSQFFQFAILEVCDINSSDDYISGRETHWKTVLRSREFGLNKN